MRISRPTSVRTGIFLKVWGLLEDKRPVLVTVWLSDVWILPVSRIDQCRQSVGISRFEFAQFTPLDDFGGNLVPLARQILQNVGPGRVSRLGLLARRELQPIKKHFLELLGRADGETAPRPQSS